ncbi:MAG: hemerythrin domain-containing protein [Chloroflexi bacterium]|jgi:hypothetical protein|nr:hemerythrin domain-containing protein [Chloroflexota bacterium]
MSHLKQVSDEHRDRLMAHVESLPGLADDIERGSASDAASTLAAEHDFLVQALVPHMAAVETSVYPELDRLLSCRLAMTPMAREHETIRMLVIRLGEIRGDLTAGTGDRAEIAGLLRQLHDTLEPHLREEDHYVPILDHYLEAGRADAVASAVGGHGPSHG